MARCRSHMRPVVGSAHPWARQVLGPLGFSGFAMAFRPSCVRCRWSTGTGRVDTSGGHAKPGYCLTSTVIAARSGPGAIAAHW